METPEEYQEGGGGPKTQEGEKARETQGGQGTMWSSMHALGRAVG